MEERIPILKMYVNDHDLSIYEDSSDEELNNTVSFLISYTGAIVGRFIGVMIDNKRQQNKQYKKFIKIIKADIKEAINNVNEEEKR
jgi:hypothetical protein